MSHRESGQIAPFITGCNPTTFSSSGTVSVQIDGTRFGTGMEVSCDAALGTISNVVITHPTATSSRVVFDLAVSAPSGSASRNITLSNAGISNGNSTQTVTHGFTPGALFDPTTPDGGFWDSTDTTKTTLYTSFQGGGVSQWDSSSGISSSLISGSSQVTSAPSLFPNSVRGFMGSATTNNQTKGFEMSVSGVSLSGPGNAYSVGFVIYIPQSVIDAGTNDQAGVYNYQKLGLCYSASEGVIFYNTKSSSPSSSSQHNSLKVSVTTQGVYTVLGTSDGSTTGARLYVNGVTQGPPSAALAIDPTVNGPRVYSKNAPDVLLGDFIAIERELTATEASDLHAYWQNKFT
jgi:hypothetical protein